MSPTTSAHLGLFLSAVIVGSSFPVVAMLSDAVPPLLATAARFTIAAATMLAVSRRPQRRMPRGRALLLHATLGLCLAGFFGTMFWAAGRISALAMAAIYPTVPLLAYLLGRMVGVERPAPMLLTALLLGATGALSLAWARDPGADGLRPGVVELIYAAGCVACALHPVLNRWGLERGWLPTSPTERTLWSAVAGALLIGAAGLILESPGSLALVTAGDWLILGYLGVVSSGFTFWLMQRATQVLTPGGVTAYSYLTPFVSMIALLIQDPSLIGWQWVPGSLLIVAAMTLLRTVDGTEPASVARLGSIHTRLPTPCPCVRET